MERQRLIVLFSAVAVLIVALAFVFMGCNGTAKYKVTVEGEYASDCEVGRSYSAGEEVTVKLPTITEHYYSLYVNGESQQKDMSHSDMTFTYFTFIMPECDVTIKIEGHSVDVPEAPKQEGQISAKDELPKKNPNSTSKKYKNGK